MEDLFNPECVGCTAFAVALNEALQLLSMVDSDANNVQLDIARYRRSNHRAITAAEEELSDSRPEPRFNSAAHWRDAEYIDPQTISDARFQMCAQLHRALYGDVWARPESPAAVWAEMLDRIERAARALRR